jgi:hypothetical protein
MKSQFIRVAMLPALVLASSWLSFAGDQPGTVQPQTQGKSESQDAPVPRAVQQGKGGAVSRNQLRANAYRSQTGEDSAGLKDQSGAVRSNAGDIAFRK